MGTGRLGRLLKTTSKSKSSAESKGKAPATAAESPLRRRQPTLSIDTRPLAAFGSRQSYGTIGDQQSIYGGPSVLNCRSSETYRNGHLLFNVPEEVDDDELEVLLEEDGLYLGSYHHLVRVYSIVPTTSLLVWVLLAVAPPLLWPSPSSTTPQAPYFPTPLPELLLSISLFALSHQLNPYLFTFAGVLLPHPTATSVLGTALHAVLRTALRAAAFPTLALAVPGGTATFRAPAFQRVWWLALGWSLAEVTAGVVQWYEMLELYRDALVPESDAHGLVASVTSTWPPPQTKTDRSESASPPLAADESLRESLSRGEDGGFATEVLVESPVRGRQQQRQAMDRLSCMTNDAEIQLEVDRDFDELVAVKAREELEELYGYPAIRVPVFVLCLLRIASILLSLGIVLLLSAAYLTSPLAVPPHAEDTFVATRTIPPLWSDGLFWGTFLSVCAVNWSLSLLQSPVFLPRVGVHVVAYLGFLVGLGMLFTGLGMWDALS
ncbi:hypothetical protein BC827DRAFT_891362 [Russula dissimulans]|nr:hypothetical protein BC827DRAFT_891362 [Russula dissimulans]